MKVLLLTEVKNLGAKGEVKEVADGYGLNFLLPKKLAVLATPQMTAKFEAEAVSASQAAERDLKKAQSLAGKLDGLELDFKTKANPEGKLFAAVSTSTIVNELAKLGFLIDKSQIVLGEPIKIVGEHKALIKFRHGLEAEVLVRVGSL